MCILTNLFKFAVPQEELVNIYTLYIRSVVEQSCVVWHSSLSSGERYDLDRIQKVALSIILKDRYKNYRNVYSSAIRTAKCVYTRNKIADSFGDSRKLWNVLKESLNLPLKRSWIRIRRVSQSWGRLPTRIPHGRSAVLITSSIPSLFQVWLFDFILS